MAAAVVTEGSKQFHKTSAGLIETAQIVLSAAGETGVTYPFRGRKILGAFVTGNIAEEGGAFTAAWSGTTVTVKSVAGATGDATTVSLMIVGF